MQLIVFRLDGQLLRAAARRGRAHRARLEATPFLGAPARVIGAIDVAGRVLPVLCIRRRFGLLERQIDPADQLLIARTAHRAVVLAIDEHTA